jgi:phage gp45-like
MVVKVDDSEDIPRVTVEGLDGEEWDLPLRGQPHGMTSVPKPGMVGYLYCANGRPDQAYLGTLEDPKKRKEFADRKEGENTLYADKNQEIHMNENGDMLLKSPNGIVHINPGV